MNSWVDRCGEFFIKAGFVPEDDKEVFEYGISQGLFLIFNMLIFFVILCYFRIIVLGVIFLILFWPLRIFAGGYHAKTRMRCVLMSTFIEVMVCNIICRVSIKGNILICFAIISAYIIYKLAPVNTEKRYLDIREHEKFQSKVCRQLLIESVLLFVAELMKWQILCKVIVIALFLVAMLLVIEKVKVVFERRKK